MKKQIKIATGAAAVLLIGLIGFCARFLSGSGSTEYYSQIDNSRVEQVDPKQRMPRPSSIQAPEPAACGNMDVPDTFIPDTPLFSRPLLTGIA